MPYNHNFNEDIHNRKIYDDRDYTSWWVRLVAPSHHIIIIMAWSSHNNSKVKKKRTHFLLHYHFMTVEFFFVLFLSALSVCDFRFPYVCTTLKIVWIPAQYELYVYVVVNNIYHKLPGFYFMLLVVLGDEKCREVKTMIDRFMTIILWFYD